MSEANTGARSFEIVVLIGLHAGARFVLDRRSHTVIGRDLACDVTLRDVSVADRHLMLVMLDGWIKLVSLNGEVEISGLPVPNGKERVVRCGERITLGDVLIGLGEQGTVWESETEIAGVLAQTRWASVRARFHHWLAQSEKRRRGIAASIFVSAGLCILLPLVIAFSQWIKHNKIGAPDETTAVRQIEQRLAEMKLPGLRVFVDRSAHAVVVEGYVLFEEDIRRVERISLKVNTRPMLRLYSQERIERQAQEYVQRQLRDATVRASLTGEVQIESAQALKPKFKDWLREQLMRDIPGVHAVVFDGPVYSRIQEIAPDPFSILSIGAVRFLLSKDGERFFPGSELSKGVLLNRIEPKSIFVESEITLQQRD
ncbi:FHA domain-containing protein [Burkholderia pyrrocinia]